MPPLDLNVFAPLVNEKLDQNQAEAVGILERTVAQAAFAPPEAPDADTAVPEPSLVKMASCLREVGWGAAHSVGFGLGVGLNGRLLTAGGWARVVTAMIQMLKFVVTLDWPDQAVQRSFLQRTVIVRRVSFMASRKRHSRLLIVAPARVGTRDAAWASHCSALHAPRARRVRPGARPGRQQGGQRRGPLPHHATGAAHTEGGR